MLSNWESGLLFDQEISDILIWEWNAILERWNCTLKMGMHACFVIEVGWSFDRPGTSFWGNPGGFGLTNFTKILHLQKYARYGLPQACEQCLLALNLVLKIIEPWRRKQ